MSPISSSETAFQSQARQLSTHFQAEIEDFRSIARLHGLPTGTPVHLAALPLALSQDRRLRSDFSEMVRALQNQSPDFSLSDALLVLTLAIGGNPALALRPELDEPKSLLGGFLASLGRWPGAGDDTPITDLDHPSDTDPRIAMKAEARAAERAAQQTAREAAHQTAALVTLPPDPPFPEALSGTLDLQAEAADPAPTEPHEVALAAEPPHSSNGHRTASAEDTPPEPLAQHSHGWNTTTQNSAVLDTEPEDPELRDAEAQVSEVQDPDNPGSVDLASHDHRTLSRITDVLSRLERSTLELRFHLDSIDQRISRMEPLLESSPGHPQPTALTPPEPKPELQSRPSPPPTRAGKPSAPVAPSPSQPPPQDLPLVHRDSAPPAVSPVPQAPARDRSSRISLRPTPDEPATPAPQPAPLPSIAPAAARLSLEPEAAAVAPEATPEPSTPPQAAAAAPKPRSPLPRRDRFAAARELPGFRNEVLGPDQPLPSEPFVHLSDPLDISSLDPDPVAATPPAPATPEPAPSAHEPAPTPAPVPSRAASSPATPSAPITTTVVPAPDRRATPRSTPDRRLTPRYVEAASSEPPTITASQDPRPARARRSALPPDAAPARSSDPRIAVAARPSDPRTPVPARAIAPTASAPEAPALRPLRTPLFGAAEPAETTDEPATSSRRNLWIAIAAILLVAIASFFFVFGSPLSLLHRNTPAANTAAPASNDDPVTGGDAAPAGNTPARVAPAPSRPSAGTPRSPRSANPSTTPQTSSQAASGRVLGARESFTPTESGEDLVQSTDSPTFVPEAVMDGHLLSAPHPVYPRLAGVIGAKGRVVFEAMISKEGAVESLHALGGSRFLKDAASNAVRQWEYRPFLVKGEPVEVRTIIRVDVDPNDTAE